MCIALVSRSPSDGLASFDWRSNPTREVHVWNSLGRGFPHEAPNKTVSRTPRILPHDTVLLNGRRRVDGVVTSAKTGHSQ
jgi:hypothetical protein